MSAAKVGDSLVAIKCHCGVQLVAGWGEPGWSCRSCGHSGYRMDRYRLLDVGWEAA